MREFGGKDVKKNLNAYSNIVFSNGSLDPWRAGGVGGLQADQEWIVNLGLPYYIINGGAHHLDLRLPSSSESGTDVEWVRAAETRDLEGYITAY